MERLKTSKDNKQERMNFIKYWAKYVRTHTDDEWGEQHTKFINSLLKNAKNFPLTAQEYLKMKGEKGKENTNLK